LKALARALRVRIRGETWGIQFSGWAAKRGNVLQVLERWSTVELRFWEEGGRLAPAMPQIKITLKLFGSLREASDESTLQIEFEHGARVADVRNWLAERNPLVEKLGDRLAASVNLEIADLGDALSDGDEVAFLPPVAGGDGNASEEESTPTKRCTISDQALDEQEVAARVEGPDAGGVVGFICRVRNHARGQSIEHHE
jgi:molybdopterin converting factor small subunit